MGDLLHADELHWETGMCSLPSAEGSSLSQPVLPESNPHPLEINRKFSLEFLWPPVTPVVPCVTDSDISYVSDLIFVS